MNNLIFNTTLSDGSKFLIVEWSPYFELKRVDSFSRALHRCLIFKTEMKRDEAVQSAREIIRNMEKMMRVEK